MNHTKTNSRIFAPETSSDFIKKLTQLVQDKKQVDASIFKRVALAADASHYLLTPSVVITPQNAEELAKILNFASEHGEKITFRSGGTSLSGQASTNHILIDTRKYFRNIEVLNGGLQVRIQPGATVQAVNARLVKYGRKLGPDPASEIAATIGGVIANNSSGMACGIKQNSYQTIKSAIIVLASGQIIDTSKSDAAEIFKASAPDLYSTLESLRAQILSSNDLVNEIIRQYSIKNTMGYGLNSLIDYSDPLQILLHLMVGSEGTLGFIAEATFNTVPILPYAATALLIFDSLDSATHALNELIATNPTTIELLDASSLRVIQKDVLSKSVVPNIDITDHAAFLLEYQAQSHAELQELVTPAETLLKSLALSLPVTLTSDPNSRSILWRLRKGLYAAVAGERPIGTTALLEDISVPIKNLSRTCQALKTLFNKYSFRDVVIFGHAKDGNIHFLLNIDFKSELELNNYIAFTEEMVELVLDLRGSLKAEHGTGRIMAPFVQRQFGQVLYSVMVAIKKGCDPLGMLNPDSVLTSNSQIHLENLKTFPKVEASIEKCVECGYCEPVCPSKNLTTTPRQRIVISRAISEAVATKNIKLIKSLQAEEKYQLDQTCAVDGMCQTACPVSINTGDLVTNRRQHTNHPVMEFIWTLASNNWEFVINLTSTGIRLLPIIKNYSFVNRRRKIAATPETSFIYFQSCTGSIFGKSQGSIGVATAIASLADKAGLFFATPSEISGLCCGTPWKSKGMIAGYQNMSKKLVDQLWESSRNGQLPIISDSSSCTDGILGAINHELSLRGGEFRALKVIDSVDYFAEEVLPKLTITKKFKSLALHPTCSTVKAGGNKNLSAIGDAIAEKAEIPADWGCCGFAGDRGIFHPELTSSATEVEATAVIHGSYDSFASCNRTCEIGMSKATGASYKHILELLDSATE